MTNIYNYLIVFFILFSLKVESSSLRDSLLLNLKSANLVQKFEIFTNLSTYYDYNQHDSSLYFSLEAFNIAKEINDPKILCKAYRNLGISYDLMGAYQLALESYSQALDLTDNLEGEQKFSIKASLIHDMGLINQELREYEIAKQQMHFALNMFKSLEDSSELISSFHALGSLSWEIKEYDSALIFLNTASKIYKEFYPKDLEGKALIDCEIVQTYYYKNDLVQAKKLYNEISENQKVEEYSEYAKAYLIFDEALILSLEGQFHQSLELLESIIVLSDEIGLKEEAINVRIEMVEIAERAKDFEKAFFYSQDLLNREREWLNIQKVALTKAKETTLKTKEKDKQILVQEASIQNRNKVILIISVLSFLVLILAIFVYRNYKSIKAKNVRIDALIRELHHRVKNNLQVISSLLSLQSMRLEDGEAKAAVEEGRSRIKAMAMIHQKLYLDDNIAEVDSEEYLIQLLQDLSSSFGISEDKWKANIISKKLDIDTILPIGLILNELVSNAFKYAFKDNENALLSVDFEVRDNEVRLFIGDNGIGMPQDFDFANRNSFGLKLVNLLVKQLKGDIKVESNNGLSYDLKFKLNKMAA